ncbi:MAG: hypothetical protein JSV04_10005 [Candidatus Heimdallarchaeota archaeon]|nr:MAG: hypothetical protein JSV04_10005 [Candidatus Heimdallarchaeota archaeon]
MSAENALIIDFQSLGLTLNEAKVLIALVKLGNSAEVSEIVEISDVPRSKIYQALEGLETKQIVMRDEIKGSANVSRLIFDTPSKLISFLESKKVRPVHMAAKRATNDLMEIASTEAGKEGVHEVWIIKGLNNINRIEKEIIDSAKHKILSNLYPEFLEPIITNLQKAKKRDVHIKLVMLENEVERLSESVEVESLSSYPITGISIEKFRSMIEILPFEGTQKENLLSTLTLFGQFLAKRPNFLMVDPDTDNATAMLIFESSINPPYSSAIQTKNQDFVNTFSSLMNLILTIATNLRSLQDQFSRSE